MNTNFPLRKKNRTHTFPMENNIYIEHRLLPLVIMRGSGRVLSAPVKSFSTSNCNQSFSVKINADAFCNLHAQKSFRKRDITQNSLPRSKLKRKLNDKVIKESNDLCYIEPGDMGECKGDKKHCCFYLEFNHGLISGL